ncbi:MAG: type I-E CRISPR-associated protein Cas7/Cse4/CasC [Ruminococcus sp.]|jgi:CRISPR system Cascade subunit CasC|nr:type I-E CRISPR-associated protein Cas7/Cse4/CasC [Ruminococcus sp.]
MANLYLDIHVLQTVPPSCINRDDTGSPKTAVYGGTLRARVSSQAWKKAVRDYFKSNAVDSGIRTKNVQDLIADEIRNLGGSDPDKNAEKILRCTKIQADKKNPEKTGALFFISKAQARALAELAVGDDFDKAKAEAAINDNPAIDMALFGRMVADDAGLNIDASAQVAHAISTHRVNNEYDYFTALDDNKTDEDSAGAGMLGTIEYNSSTLYRYATVALHDLKNYVGEKTGEAAAIFTKAFICSMPTGKQNTFANRTLPYAAYICLRGDQPINLAGAFEKAVTAKNDGFAEASSKKLAEHAAGVYADWAEEPLEAYAVGNIDMGQKISLKDLTEKLEAEISKIV